MKNNLKNNMMQLSIKGALFLSLLAAPGGLMAQDEAVKTTPSSQTAQYEMSEITGQVIDAATKKPLSGVRVEALNDMRYTAMTDENGNYKIKVPEFVKSLYVSTSDYSSAQYAIRGQQEINMVLYSDQFKQQYTNGTNVMNINQSNPGLTSSLTADEEIENQLGGDVRSISRSGMPAIGAAMFIRGLNSLNANAQPLVVLDGVMLDKQEGRITMHDGFFNNILSGIEVGDIESIRVLKNGTALYGARGANGVILIDTKRGRSMATRIDANIFAGVTLEPTLPEMMGANDYRLYASEMVSSFSTNKKLPWLTNDVNDYYYKRYHNNTDWSDYIYKEAFTQNYKVNVQGGDKVAMYNFSLGLTQADAPIEANDFSRLNIRFNTDITLIKNLTTKFDISYSRVNRDLRDDGVTTDYTAGPVVSPTYLSLIKSPILHPYAYDVKGNLSPTLDGADADLANLANPLAIINTGDGENKNAQEYTVFNVGLTPRLQLSKNVAISTMFNYTLSRMNERYFRGMTAVPKFYLENKGVIENESSSLFAKEENLYSDTRVDFTKKWGAHSLDVFGGFRFMYSSYLSNYQTGYNTGNDKMPNLSTSLSYRTVGGDDDEWINLAYYANAEYNYQNKYFVQGILSAETSSRFGSEAGGLKLADVCWGIFPSLQAAWLISSEDWFKASAINYLKLTAGYDVSGNDDMNYLASRTYFGSKQYADKAMGLQLQNIGNETLKWETTRRMNVGLELSLLKNRLQLSASAFMSKTSDLLTLIDYPEVAGLKQYWGNSGELENRGVEFAFNAKLVNTSKFKWELGASASHYKNEITSQPGGKETISTFCNAEILTREGEAAGVFYGYKTNGVFASDAAASAAHVNEDGTTSKLYQLASNGARQEFAAGDIHFVDLTGDGRIDKEDKTIIGNPNPDLYGNIYTNLHYKRFSLNIGLNYSLGNDVYNYQRSQLEGGSNLYNQTTAMLNRWSGEGHITNMPHATYGDPMGNGRFSDRWIEDGSYLRLKNVTFSYKVPVPVTWSWLQGVTVWCSANNLLTFTKYLGSDPEFSAGNSVLYQGIDTGMLPLSRNFNVGVKVNL